jgi:hypothetical protein
MAFARVAVFPGGTRQQYEAVNEALGAGLTDQPERILLAAGQTDEGWQIIQIWESRDGLDRFIEEHLRPAMEKAGDRGYQAPPRITDFEVADLNTR